MTIPLPRKTCLFVVASLCLAQLSTALAATDARAVGTALSTLFVDGVSCGQVQQWKGGEIFGDVVAEPGTSSKKHLGATHYSPITVELSLPLAAPLVSWINDFLANNNVRKTLTLADFSLDGKTAAFSIDATNAMLIEVDFDGVDGTSKDAAGLTLVFSAEVVRPGSSSASAPSPIGKTKRILSNSFNLTLDGVATDHVMSVAAFTAKRRSSGTSVGEKRVEETELQPVELSNLIVTLAATQSADWTAWQENFLVKGNNSDSQEKSGGLDLQDAAKKSAFSLRFSHVGMVRLTRVPIAIGSEGIRKLQAELYYEGLSLVPSGTEPAGGTKSDSKTDASGSKTDTAGTKTDGTKDTTGTSSSSTDPKKSDDSSGKSPTGGTGADGSTAAASDDDGAQDPTDFPRIPGLTRLSFTSARQPASAQETATYSAKLAHDDLVSTYEKTLKEAGWDEALKNESGDPATGSHQFRLRWTKKGQTADIRLTQLKAELSGVSVDVTTTRAGSLPGINVTKTKVPDAISSKGATGDQGARDPADFPRISNSTRKSYSALGSTAAPQEMAVYAAKLPIDQVEAFYVKNLPGSDWTETYRREMGDSSSGTHVVTTKWSKGSRTATVALTETNSDNTQIDATVIGAVK